MNQYSGMVDVMPEFIVMHSTPVRVDEPSSISEGTLPALVEEWESWYPQEWVGWIMYGCGLTAGPRTGGEVGEGGGRKAWANEGKVGGIDLC